MPERPRHMAVDRNDSGATGDARLPREMFAHGCGLYLIVTRPSIPHADLVAAAVEMGVPVVQLREKTLCDRELAALASELVSITRPSRTLFVVNDRPDVAAMVGADGAHVGTSDVDARSARLLLGPNALLGVSGNTAVEARAAAAVGADYVGVAPVFPTATKPDAFSPVGLRGVSGVASGAPDVPIVAVGGIDASSAAAVVKAGARYVGVVSAVCRAPDPVAAIEKLIRALGTPAFEPGD